MQLHHRAPPHPAPRAAGARELPRRLRRGRRPRRLARARSGSTIRRSTPSRSATARRSCRRWSSALERGGDLARVPGLVLNRGGAQVATGHAPARRELDTLPMPARHLIARYAPHYYINFRKPLALMETARGCPFKCNFCSVWKFHESTFREKSPARVVEELQAIEAPNVFITDDIFWMNVKRGEEMARRSRPRASRSTSPCRRAPTSSASSRTSSRCGRSAASSRSSSASSRSPTRGSRAVNKKNTAANNERAIEILKELRRRLHAELHRRSGLGPRRLRAAARVDRAHGRLQQRLLGAHAAARHRPLGRGQAAGHHARLGDVRHHPRRAADEAAARGVLRASTPVSGATCSTCATSSAARRGPTCSSARRSPPGKVELSRGAQGDEHRQGVQQAGDLPRRAPRHRSLNKSAIRSRVPSGAGGPPAGTGGSAFEQRG